MSITAARPVLHSLAERLYALLSPLFAGISAQGRLYGGLKDLPDHLLLDIGVDPRDVPAQAECEIARSDLMYARPGARGFRNVAKS